MRDYKFALAKSVCTPTNYLRLSTLVLSIGALNSCVHRTMLSDMHQTLLANPQNLHGRIALPHSLSASISSSSAQHSLQTSLQQALSISPGASQVSEEVQNGSSTHSEHNEEMIQGSQPTRKLVEQNVAAPYVPPKDLSFLPRDFKLPTFDSIQKQLPHNLTSVEFPNLSAFQNAVPPTLALPAVLPKELQNSITKPAEETSQKSMATIWFVEPSRGQMKLVSVRRHIDKDNAVSDAVRQLLDGPASSETTTGMGSEIPRGTILLGVKESGDEIELNLSKRFASEGGIDSIETRIQQLSKTIAAVAGNRKVYLNVEGRRLTMTPGEGIEVKQPINR